ncbi:TPA: hypothetical protein DDW69_03855 [candidate division CPR2 bacterium]|uniref:SprT-like domain-containing protein n=1 Tax=candidate division CPR2 bacterium GW2011_GWC1_41_48 TaxID=1618344 RepID=A0A0G0W7P1_UNCC2|nr:MAG: hypothetical protein UT47_C0003G0041 [candidate division CPR2 bacterium GW2011_GWC2_39_35]KKR28453.1 MAG: hypothetical protein UT59_C0027G0008 [candidate division CPR2 bacterium GW2011_GWD1_39_7]KKR29325.1 MAG: hypothetical protein UT60_C0003G0002 [candidate division CPR2 bacterium GW2011_GWD2_39_7]KKS08980.1 MAG: hypothetical protein UU65_C0003G0035 [candidate division CPR2 bacterium GW2011_GWC1_41_48]OGB60950.1 MAG: hypothetical protein A2Y27_03525 [candidate division CPR2 bacterium G
MRDNRWLELKLQDIWNRYFLDIEKLNDVKIRFGRKARTRLGSIKKQDDGSTLITINSLLKIGEVPEFVIQGTIAHELVHYAHGFSSPHLKRFDHPHKGGVVGKEMATRGLEDILILQKRWLKENWKNFLDSHHPRVATKRKVRRKKIKRYAFLLKR